MAEPQDVNQSPNPAANLPLNPDLMGFPTVEALVNAKRASDQEAQRIVMERDALKNQLQYVYQAQANPRQDDPSVCRRSHVASPPADVSCWVADGCWKATRFWYE